MQLLPIQYKTSIYVGKIDVLEKDPLCIAIKTINSPIVKDGTLTPGKLDVTIFLKEELPVIKQTVVDSIDDLSEPRLLSIELDLGQIHGKLKPEEEHTLEWNFEIKLSKLCKERGYLLLPIRQGRYIGLTYHPSLVLLKKTPGLTAILVHKDSGNTCITHQIIEQLHDLYGHELVVEPELLEQLTKDLKELDNQKE